LIRDCYSAGLPGGRLGFAAAIAIIGFWLCYPVSFRWTKREFKVGCDLPGTMSPTGLWNRLVYLDALLSVVGVGVGVGVGVFDLTEHECFPNSTQARLEVHVFGQVADQRSRNGRSDC